MSNISKQTIFNNIPLFKKLQLIRNLVQISIFLLLIAGFYSKIRPGFIFLLPLAFVAGNFFVAGSAHSVAPKSLSANLVRLFSKRNLKLLPFYKNIFNIHAIF